jgi:hypothetical protein
MLNRFEPQQRREATADAPDVRLWDAGWDFGNRNR